MSEKQETVHVVLRRPAGWGTHKATKSFGAAVKVFDDRKDARAYAKRMNARPNARYRYTVYSCKKG